MVQPIASRQGTQSRAISHDLTIAILKKRLRPKDGVPVDTLTEVARQIDDGVPRRQIVLDLHSKTSLTVSAISRLVDQRYQTVYNTILAAEERTADLAARNVQLVTCTICGRPLHDPKSTGSHIGPACSRKHRNDEEVTDT